jgi:hypothetical protein
MSVLLAAVEAGSLSKASRTLGLPLATVSRRVSELEGHLKADLLIRSFKGLELTPAGQSGADGRILPEAAAYSPFLRHRRGLDLG